MAWAYEHDIAQGMSDTRFVPNAPVTREQLVTFLYRYAKLQGVDTTNQGSLDGFVDAGTVSSFAQEAMTWAVATELILGMGNQYLEPKASSSRGQIATVVERFETVHLA